MINIAKYYNQFQRNLTKIEIRERHMDIKNRILLCLEEIGVIIDSDITSDEIDIVEYIEDSLMFIHFIVAIENEFCVSIPNEYLSLERLSSIDVLSNIILSLLECSDDKQTSK